MDNQDSDFLKAGQIAKKTYEAPRLKDLDVTNTEGKGFPQITEFTPSSASGPS